jgi:hypothetical protein
MTDELSLSAADGIRVIWDRQNLAALASGNGSGGAATLEGSLSQEWDAVRIVSGAAADGSLLALCAARPAGAANHDTDAVAAAVVDPEGTVHEIEEALLSTEYAADGRVRRFGIELYRPGNDYPLRAVGDAIEDGGEGDAVTLSFRLDGSEGTALYEIVRRA